MRRYIPEVRALYERVRRPAITILLGLGLTAPLGLSILGPSSDDEEVQVSTREGSNPPNGEGNSPEQPESGVTHASQSSVETRESGEAAGSEEPARPEREAAPARRYAQEFKISFSLADQIHRAAVAEGIDPKIAFGLVETESSFRRTVISSAGAVGYTQLLPSTARWIAPGTTRSQLFNTQTNLRVGFKYLNYLVDKYNGNMRLALTAYNRGPGTVDRLLRQGRNPENGYATKVLRARA